MTEIQTINQTKELNSIPKCFIPKCFIPKCFIPQCFISEKGTIIDE